MTTKTRKSGKSVTGADGSEEQKRINQAAIDLLRSWIDAYEEEARDQRETGEYLRKVLDEDRPPGFKLFS